MLFCGIDLHSNNCFVVISDENDKVLYSRRHPNSLEEICSALSPYRADLFGVVVESTFNWYWLVDGLQDAVIPSIWRTRQRSNSMMASNIAAMNPMPGIWHTSSGWVCYRKAISCPRPSSQCAVRELARKCMQLVQLRTVQILSIETMFDQQRGAHLSSNHIKKLSSADIDNMGFGHMETLAMKANLAVMHALQTQVDAIEKELAKHCRSNPAFALLKSVAGIGDVLATVILLETGSIDRFADVGNYASYCRCVGSVHESNGKKKGEGNTKNGNRYLAWAYVEAANFAIRYNESAKKFYQRKKAKRNGVVAIKAVVHKLARACFHMLKTGEIFSVERCFT